MKKLVAIVLSLMLCLSMMASIAESTIPELYWEDVEAQLAEAGAEGDFVSFEDAGVAMWVPTVLQSVDLTDEFLEAGYIGYFATADQSAAVGVRFLEVENMTAEAYAANVAEVGGTDVELVYLNDLLMVTYLFEEGNSLNASLVYEDGYILEISFVPANDEGFANTAKLMMMSIMEDGVEETEGEEALDEEADLSEETEEE